MTEADPYAGTYAGTYPDDDGGQDSDEAHGVMLSQDRRGLVYVTPWHRVDGVFIASPALLVEQPARRCFLADAEFLAFGGEARSGFRPGRGRSQLIANWATDSGLTVEGDRRGRPLARGVARPYLFRQP